MGPLLGRTWATGREGKGEGKGGCVCVEGFMGVREARLTQFFGCSRSRIRQSQSGTPSRRPRVALRFVGGTCVPFRASGFGVLLSLVIFF